MGGACRAPRRGEGRAMAKSRFSLGLGKALAALACATASARGQSPVGIDREPISYSTTPATDPVARLQGKLDRGEVRLRHDEEGAGYLRSVLEALGVPTETQTLVFSKTSFQHNKIAPRTPRAVYFGDDVYV